MGSTIVTVIVTAATGWIIICRKPNGVPLELSIDVKLKDFIKREWLPYCSMMNHVSERGVEDYARIAEKRIIPVIGSKRMVDVRIQDIERIYIQMLAVGLSGTTCRRVHEVLRSIYNRAVQIGLLTPEKNPINRVKPPRIDKAYKYKVFTEEQAKRFIQALHMEYPITCPAHTRKNQNGTEYEVKAYKFPKPVTISTMFHLHLDNDEVGRGATESIIKLLAGKYELISG